MASKQKSHCRLGEKAFRGGGKSEDQPFSENMPKPSMEGPQVKQMFRDERLRENSLFTKRMSKYVYYYISLEKGMVCRETMPPLLCFLDVKTRKTAF